MKGNVIGALLKKGLHSAKSGSPVILAGLAAAGVVTTAIFAVKAAKKAEKRVDEALEEKKAKMVEEAAEDGEAYPQDKLDEVKLTKKEFVKTILPSYAPAIIMGVLTIACILGGLNISLRRQAALTAAYNISEKAIKNYEKALPEVIGEEQAAKVKDQVTKNEIAKANQEDIPVEITGTGNQLCIETFTGRRFRSTAAHVQKIINDLNEEINHFGYVCLNDFYSGMNLSNNDCGDMLGWGPEGLIDVQYSSMLSEDNEPILAITFTKRPITDYDKFGC